MIPRSRTVAFGAFVIAVGLHVGAGADWSGEDLVEIAGGAPSTAAVFGSSFADMVQGTAEPVEPDEVLEQEPTENPPEKVEEQTTETKAVEMAAETPPVAPTPTVTATELSTALPAQPVSPTDGPALPKVQQTEPAKPLQTAALAVKPQEVTEPLEDTEAPTTPTQSKRPMTRPKELEARAEPPKTDPKPRKKPAPQPQGSNSNVNTKKGSETGKAKKGAATNSKTASKSKTAGNAAMSNYTGKVFRRIDRARPRNIDIRGKVKVSLKIGPGGNLVSVWISGSSGSARLDNIALASVRRAAPFPPTPDGNPLTVAFHIRGDG